MSLTYLNFSNGTSGYIATVYLQFSRNLLLCKSGSFTQASEIISNSFLNQNVHYIL